MTVGTVEVVRKIESFYSMTWLKDLPLNPTDKKDDKTAVADCSLLIARPIIDYVHAKRHQDPLNEHLSCSINGSLVEMLTLKTRCCGVVWRHGVVRRHRFTFYKNIDLEGNIMTLLYTVISYLVYYLCPAQEKN